MARYKLSEDPGEFSFIATRRHNILGRGCASRNDVDFLSSRVGKTLDLHSVVVQSELVKESLGRVLEGYPGITTELERLEFGAPFECFVHRWDRLLGEREELARKREEGGRGDVSSLPYSAFRRPKMNRKITRANGRPT